MKLRTYSSLAAFMAHYAALSRAHAGAARPPAAAALNSQDAATLEEMERLLGELSAADRAALAAVSPISTGPAARHRARAELKLRRMLAARGVLAG
jgi:hypothetical protein